MKPAAIDNYSVRAHCPDCGALSIFDYKDSSHEFGSILKDESHEYDGIRYSRVHYRLLRCSGCGRAGLAKFLDSGRPPTALESFYPRALESASIPTSVPEGIVKEYREAELCASIEAWRAASTLLRSALEKALKANGYTKGPLQQKIDDASSDGVITSARRQKAHDDIRVLGNEVVHDEWREVTETEVDAALHYVQRILEDLYDDRGSVEQILISKKRLPSP